MAFKELLSVRNPFFVNVSDYYNTFECYSKQYLMWVASLKKRVDVLELMKERGFTVVSVNN